MSSPKRFFADTSKKTKVYRKQVRSMKMRNENTYQQHLSQHVHHVHNKNLRSKPTPQTLPNDKALQSGVNKTCIEQREAGGWWVELGLGSYDRLTLRGRSVGSGTTKM